MASVTMQKKLAQNLHNRDQVEIKIGKEYISGYVLGDPAPSKDGKILWFHIQTDSHGFLDMVNHKDLK